MIKKAYENLNGFILTHIKQEQKEKREQTD